MNSGQNPFSPQEALLGVRSELERLGRPDVRIIAVSKTHGPERIEEFLRLGHRDFGENRQNEARDKFPLVDATVCPPGGEPVYHHIGPLQSGSARQIPGLFQYVHGVGSASALNALADALTRKVDQGAAPGKIRYLIQVRLTDEAGKAGGVQPAGLPELLAARPTHELLEHVGYMTMGPLGAGESAKADMARRVFRELRRLRDETLPGGELSMGMSGDWRIAVEEGASMIRLGTMLFGKRGGGPWKP